MFITQSFFYLISKINLLAKYIKFFLTIIQVCLLPSFLTVQAVNLVYQHAIHDFLTELATFNIGTKAYSAYLQQSGLPENKGIQGAPDLFIACQWPSIALRISPSSLL